MAAGHDTEAYFREAEALLRRKSGEKRQQLTLVAGTEHLRWFVTPQEAGEGQRGAPDWTLSHSPLRTFRFAQEKEETATICTKEVAAETGGKQELDDFFGVMEGDLESGGGGGAAAEENANGQEKGTEKESEAQVCELRPSWRVPIDLEKEREKKDQGVRWHAPPKKTIWKKTVEAIAEFEMIKPGDKVLICVSGGKDSLSLLHTLRFLQIKMAGGNNGPAFEIGAVTVDPMTVSFDPRPLIPYMAALGVPYHYEQQPLIDIAKEANASSICSWCSRMKRGIIYRVFFLSVSFFLFSSFSFALQVARTHGYNVVAMGQHLDDMAESFMMSFWLNGKLRTQKACYVVDEGDLRFIRPFAHVREADLKVRAAPAFSFCFALTK